MYRGRCDEAYSRYFAAKSDVKNLKAAIELYKEKNGVFPPSLSDLVPDQLSNLTTDPWGNEFVYEYDEKLFAVYSLGKDGKYGGTGESANVYMSEYSKQPEICPWYKLW